MKTIYTVSTPTVRTLAVDVYARRIALTRSLPLRIIVVKRQMLSTSAYHARALKIGRVIA